MKHFLKNVIPIILALLILFSVIWYFFIFDTTLTRDLLLHQARRFENDGNTSAAVWLYNLAYLQSGHDDAVAIELAEQFKAIGNYSKAESTLNKAIQNGGGLDVYIALCKTYIEQDKLRDAVTMLDKVANKDIKAQLNDIRPQAPVASVNTGTYNEYLQVDFTAESGTLYLSTDLDYPSVHTDAYTGPLVLPGGQTTAYALCIGENGLVSPLSIYGYIIKDVVEKVAFVDSAFEAAIRNQLELPQQEVIYTDMLWNVESFTVPVTATSCEDLKWMTGLKHLTIENCVFTDFTPLENLMQMQSLRVVNTTIAGSDLQFLINMHKLTELTLSGCSVSTIAHLAGLKNLQKVDLSNNTIRNVSALAEMQKLQSLNLSGNALISLKDLENLSTLRELDVSYNSLATTAPTATMVGLKKLDVSSNNLMKLEGIDSLKDLEHFSAAYNNLIDVNILSGCIKLRTLNVAHNTLLDIQVLARLPLLEELDFSYNEVSRLPSFSVECALTVIRGEHNILTSLDNLSGLKHLKYVYMDYNTKLANINSLRHCKALVEVSVFGTRVTDISMLANSGILVHYTPKV